MSLHDIDKDGNTRLNPTPNSSDQITERYAHGTVQNQNSIEDAEANGLKMLERQILAKQDGFNKAIFGFYGTANKFGLKVAEDGVDVLEAEDDELLFNSEQNTFKVIQTGVLSSPTVALNTGGANYGTQTATASTPHGLDFQPVLMGFYSAGLMPYIVYGPVSATGFMVSTIKIAASSTDIVVSSQVFGYNVNSSWPGGTNDIRYYLLQETAATT